MSCVSLLGAAVLTFEVEMMLVVGASRAGEGLRARHLGDAPKEHYLGISTSSMAGHRRLKLDPITRAERSDLLVPLLTKQQCHIGVLTSLKPEARRVHLYQRDIVRAQEHDVETFPNDAHLALPLERAAPVPLFERTGCRGPMRQRRPRAAVEEKVLPRQHRRGATVFLAGGVHLDRRPEEVEANDRADEAQKNDHVLPREDDGATPDLHAHYLGPERGKVDARLPLNHVETPGTMVDDVLECWPQKWQHPERHPPKTHYDNECQEVGHPRWLVGHEGDHRAIAVRALAKCRHIAEDHVLVRVLADHRVELDQRSAGLRRRDRRQCHLPPHGRR
mmetsp:Transcript_42936/g.124140  ORF Transcript_42936/g.124140 Transcript_42936/m.124140 type:complete len:334 (+) Transcript_42936:173-1174(+)